MLAGGFSRRVLPMRIFPRGSTVATTAAFATQLRSQSNLVGDSVIPPVRWGILSAGKISSDFAKAISITDGAEATAVAARSPSSSSSFAKKHKIPKAHASYEDLLHDPDIDVVYVGSIADQHYNLAKKSIQAGKPVVVEKPLTTNLDDTVDLINLAKKEDVFLMEGMWTRCFPAMREVSKVIASGTIGDVVSVQGDFGWSTSGCAFPDDRIWNLVSGGMTLDIGMYMVQLGQVAFPSATVECVQAMGTTLHGVDHTVLTNIMYKNSNNGRNGFLQFIVTGEANCEERLNIQGTKGRIVIDPASHIPTQFRVFADEGRGQASEQVYEYPLPDDSFTPSWNYPGSVGFTYQVTEVSDAVRRGEKECRLFTLEDSLQVAGILDEILSQVRDGNKEQKDLLNGDGVNGQAEEIKVA